MDTLDKVAECSIAAYGAALRRPFQMLGFRIDQRCLSSRGLRKTGC
jgi:hypothetical protein